MTIILHHNNSLVIHKYNNEDIVRLREKREKLVEEIDSGNYKGQNEV